MMKWRKDGGVKKVEEKEDKYWLNLETPDQRKSRFNVLNQAVIFPMIFTVLRIVLITFTLTFFKIFK